MGDRNRDRDIGVRRTRLHLGLTQAALAKRLGVSRQTVIRWESWEVGLDAPRGRKPPGPVRLAMLRIRQGRHVHTDVENVRRRADRREQRLARERGTAGYW